MMGCYTLKKGTAAQEKNLLALIVPLKPNPFYLPQLFESRRQDPRSSALRTVRAGLGLSGFNLIWIQGLEGLGFGFGGLET